MLAPRDATLAHAISEQIGANASKCTEILGHGEVNHTFIVTTAEGKRVIRFHRDPLDSDDYAGESWCMDALRGTIPVAECLGKGTCQGVNFIVQTFVEGEHADGRRSPDLWRTLGRYARIINESFLGPSSPDSLFPRFGRDLVGNWHRHIDYNLAELTATDRLLNLGAYEVRHQDRIKTIFADLRQRVITFGLTHGDLVPKNVLLPPNAPPVLIDWGSAGTGAAPFHDYLRVRQDEAEEGFTAEDLSGFAEGYGIPVGEMASTLNDLHLLDKIDKVRWAIDCRPDRIQACAAKAREVVLQMFG